MSNQTRTGLRSFACARQSLMLAIVMSAGATSALAQDVSNPGDTITGTSTNFPAGQTPVQAIDNSATPSTSTLTGSTPVSPSPPRAAGIVRGIGIITGGDAPERDPTSFLLEGSNNGVDFTMIASGPINPTTVRRSLASARFNNNTAYSQYRVRFPTIRNAPTTANSMQVAEVQLLEATSIFTPGDPFTVIYTPGATSPPNEGPATSSTARPHQAGHLQRQPRPHLHHRHPRRRLFGHQRPEPLQRQRRRGFPGRAPQYITVSGSNDGSNFTQIFTTPIAAGTANYQNQQFAFPNTTAYTQYQIEVGPTQGATFLQLGELELYGNASNAAPANDECAGAQIISAGTITSANFNATGTDTTPCGASDSSDVWFRYTAPASGMVEINTIGTPALDTTLAVYAGGCGGTLVGCNDNARGSAARITFAAVGGTDYRIRVAGVGGDTGAFSLTVIENPATHTNVTIPLAYNFNGMLHDGEANAPDSPQRLPRHLRSRHPDHRSRRLPRCRPRGRHGHPVLGRHPGRGP